MISVRPGRVGRTNRGDVQIGAQTVSQPITYPAPVGGLVTATDIASASRGSASVLRNFLPTLTGARVRGGSVQNGLVAGAADIISAFKYKYGTTEKLFVATAAGIFDMTSPAAPPTTTAADVSGLGGGDWCVFQHTNAGNGYLVCVNGADTRRLFNGASWTTTPAITFSDSTTSAQLNCGWLFKNREFFIKNATLDAYYLDVNAIGGAASVFPLGGVMKLGGSLLTGFSWSLESGDGLSDMCVFVSTEGEVAIYAGSDPSDANDFALRGIYRIGKPLGKNAWIRAGGDVLVATIDGLIPMSQVLQRDRESLSLVSVSRPIEDLWQAAAKATQYGWTLKQWPEQNLVFVSFPSNIVVEDTTFVLNVQTGRWSTLSNWRASCFETLQGSLFFGSIGGYCWQGDVTGEDDGLPFTAAYLSQFLPPQQFGQRATASLAQMYIHAAAKPNVRLFARADGNKTEPVLPAVTTYGENIGVWDVGQWDVGQWDVGLDVNRYSFRQNVRASGDSLALGCMIVSAGGTRLAVEIDLGTLQVTTGEASA